MQVTKKTGATIDIDGEDLKHLQSAIKSICTHIGYDMPQLTKDERRVLEELNTELLK